MSLVNGSVKLRIETDRFGGPEQQPRLVHPLPTDRFYLQLIHELSEMLARCSLTYGVPPVGDSPKASPPYAPTTRC
jgi:hypothetical protein